jgi:hypothetical protein
MRDLAKSFMRFTWAMSLFGLEQMGNMMSRDKTEEGEDKAQDSFKKVTDATESSFCERTKSMYEAGDKLQCEMVDAMFDVFKVSTKCDSKESEPKEEEPSSSKT